MNNLFSLLKERGIQVVYSTICGLHKPCKMQHLCSNSSTLSVIDFDDLRTQVSKKCKLSTISSVDALYFLEEIPDIFFIEIKGWKDFWNYDKSQDAQSQKQGIQLQIDEYSDSLDLKYKESLMTLESIVQLLDLDKKERKKYYTPKAHYVIVVDIDYVKEPLKKLYIQLKVVSSETLSERSFVNLCYEKTEDLVRKMEVSDEFGIANPLTLSLVSCWDLDSHLTLLVSQLSKSVQPSS